MLIENLLPHEAESTEFPPWFNISSNDAAIALRFPGALAATKSETFNESLERIRNRYLFLTDERVLLEEGSGGFCITLPLIKM
jgi:hypothetical protein